METVSFSKPSLVAPAIAVFAFSAGIQMAKAILAGQSTEMSSTAALAVLVIVLWAPLLMRNLSDIAPQRINPWIGAMACTLGFAFQAIG